MAAVMIILSAVICPDEIIAAESDSGSRAENVKICIDPGHGGENLGADWNGYLEKEMTMITANAMKDELEKYEGIEVFMTRTGDVDMDLDERIDYAKEVGADFFFCLHFNMSAEHDMYGAECWISAFGNNYARGMDFSKIEMGLLTDLGLYDRGIKTRLNDKGTNYYGVLRMGDLEDIPAVIIEHCHLDNYNDEPFYDEHDLLVKYGRLDATTVAMYYGLYSPELDKDYRMNTYIPTPVPDAVMRPDNTAPDNLSVAFGRPYETATGAKIDVEITASDPDSRMLYYSYSDDGGITWSERYRWADDEGRLIGDAVLSDTIHTTIPIRTDRDMNVIFKVYNLYNLDTVSSPYYIEKATIEDLRDNTQESGITETYEELDEIVRDDAGIPAVTFSLKDRLGLSDEDEGNRAYLIIFIILALGILLVLGILGYIIYTHNAAKKYKKRGSGSY